jgi:hypothetical protein
LLDRVLADVGARLPAPDVVTMRILSDVLTRGGRYVDGVAMPAASEPLEDALPQGGEDFAEVVSASLAMVRTYP